MVSFMTSPQNLLPGAKLTVRHIYSSKFWRNGKTIGYLAAFMTSSFFTYNKAKVIQALRYHFISRKEIKALIVIVNIFAIVSTALFYLKKINPLAFLISSVLWFTLMISFWYLMPAIIYNRAKTFKDRFRVNVGPGEFYIENANGSRGWSWSDFSTWMETPHFIHLYFNSRSFFIIPKEAFEEVEMHEVRVLLNEKITRKSRA